MTTRILIVEDEPAIAETISLFLEKRGHATAIAPDAATALMLIAQAPFDLHLIDIRLPGSQDGLALLRELLADPSRRAIPNIVLTAATDRMPEAHEAGATAVMAKPFAYEALLTAIAQRLPQTEAPSL